MPYPQRGGSAPDDEAAAIRAAAIAEAPKHRRVETQGDARTETDKMLQAFSLYTPPGRAVLTTTGRKSGKQRRICVRAIRCQDKIFVVMLRLPAPAIERPLFVSAWVHNIRTHPNVLLQLGRRTFGGCAREISDAAELDRAREAFCETVHLEDYIECAVHRRGLPSRAKIKELHRYWFDTGIPFAFEPSKQHERPN